MNHRSLRSRRTGLPIAAFLGAGGLGYLFVAVTACSGALEALPGDDAGKGGDGSSNSDPFGHDSGGGSDATVTDGGTGTVAMPVDSGLRDAADASNECEALIARILSAPIVPPNRWAGIDLSNGGAGDGGVGGGGLTIDQADILKCATSVEPDVLEAGVIPITPGARTATFTNAAGASVAISYNLDSRIIWFVETNAPATTTLSFHARAGGKFASGNPDGGLSTYEIGFGPPGNAAGGYVKKNGQDLPADWTVTTDDAGVGHASAWANEIYDGMMATYAPTVPAVADCIDVSDPRAVVPASESACLVADYLLGIRPLGTYLGFNWGTNQTTYAYSFWKGGWPTCATPRAAVEQLQDSPIYAAASTNVDLGALWAGASIGGLIAAEPTASPGGLLATEANALAGCGATSITPPDPGYVAETWGSSGVGIEYKPDSGVVYKVIASQGYNGELDLQSSEDDGGTNTYVVKVGALTLNGSPVALDWANGDAGTLNAAVTDLSNGWLWDYSCPVFDADCVQAGDCAIVPDDGHGHSTLTFLTSPAIQPTCPDEHPLTIVFPKGTSVPSEVYATNPGGE